MNDFFKIVYEDNDIMVIDKPAGLVVESENRESTNQNKTLENILKKEYKINLPRSGIVHRLDRDTSGLMVIAKSEKALVDLQNQFASHKVKKIYYSLVLGKLESKKGTINIALKRDQKNRIRFVASKSKDAKEAITRYEVIKEIKSKNQTLSFLKIDLETGRTHQIRAHFFAIGHPVIGDSVYKDSLSEEVAKRVKLERQFLHAGELSFQHPMTKKMIDFKSELPDNLSKLIV